MKIIIPFREALSNNNIINFAWLDFFRDVKTNLEPLGDEQSFAILNNQASAQPIVGLSFNKESVSCAFIDILIQRVTSTNEEVETKTFFVHYLPDSETWALSGGPSSAGVTLTIDSAGQVKYTSTNITGTIKISRAVWRARTLQAKSALYSKLNGGGNL